MVKSQMLKIAKLLEEEHTVEKELSTWFWMDNKLPSPLVKRASKLPDNRGLNKSLSIKLPEQP